MENELINILSEFITEFRVRNYLFLNESDIQSMLYSLLSDKYNESPQRLNDYFNLENQELFCPLITSEHAYFLKDEPNDIYIRHTSKKMDLAILDKDSFHKVNSIVKLYDIAIENYPSWLPVKYGIEINYCRSDNIEEDAYKLKKYKYINDENFIGIVIQFHRKSMLNEKDIIYFRDKYKYMQKTNLVEILNEKSRFKVLTLAIFPETIFYKFD